MSLYQRFGNRRIVTPGGSATMEFDRGLQKMFDRIEAQIADLTQIVLDIQAAQAAADAADTKARARMDDLPDVTFTGDYTGTLTGSQLPMDIAVKRYDGTTNVSSSSAWTAAVESGDAAVSIGAATGVLTITAISTESVVRVESVRDGLTLRKKQTFKIALADPPNTGSSGGTTSWTDTTLSSINSTTMVQITDDLTVTVGPSGTVTLTAPLTVSTAPLSPAGTYEVLGRWQWWDGAAWQDLGAADFASNPDCIVYDANGGEPPLVYAVSNGSLNAATSKAGLVAGASEKFRLMASNSSGTRGMSFSGTATASTS